MEREEEEEGIVVVLTDELKQWWRTGDCCCSISMGCCVGKLLNLCSCWKKKDEKVLLGLREERKDSREDGKKNLKKE